MRRTSIHLAAAVLLLAAAAPAAGQQAGQPAAQSGQAGAPAVQPGGGQPDGPGAPATVPDAGPPPLHEVVARARLVADSAVQAERLADRLGDAAAGAADLADAQRRLADLDLLLGSLLGSDYVRPERLSRVRDHALVEDQRLESVHTRVTERLTQLGEMRVRWTDRQRAWRSWQQSLQGDPDYALVAGEVDHALERSEAVLVRIRSSMTALLALQRDVEELRVRTEGVGAAVAAVRSGRRQALTQRAEPVLLSAEHRAQLRDEGLDGWRPAAKLRASAYLAFLRDHAGMLLFHLVLVALIALLAQRLQRSALPEGGWSGTLHAPWALGVLASSALALQRVTLAPPLWDVLLWALFAAAAAVLARGLFAARALRLTVYLLAAFYPLFLLLEVAGLPGPVFRLVIATVAALALPVFAVHARRRSAAAAAAGSNDPRRIWPLRVGAGMWAVVLVTVTFGYDLLGRWVLHATLTSAAAAFMVVLIVALLRGAIATLLRSETKHPFLRRIGVRLAQRLVVLLQAVLVFGAVLVVLDVWELAPSPVVTWQRITGAGYTIGSLHITVGRVLLGIAAVYLTLVVSWLVRTFVQSEVYRRWDFDRGVGESINALVHYSLIIIGVMVALAILGVELQNFAIIAGALGIGIGFGLQNVVSNFAAGLILLFERPVRVGDTVVVGGEWGTIRKIGLRSTVMLTFDQSEMIVPNADLVSEKVVNWTLSTPVARIILPVGVAYGSSIARVLAILTESGTAHDAVLPDPPPQALFVGFGESSLDFELRVWVKQIRQRLEVRSVVLMEVERRFAEAGIEIPFPQRDLHVRSIDPAAAGIISRL
jgi:potassium-dependent mechanosensitive channel